LTVVVVIYRVASYQRGCVAGQHAHRCLPQPVASCCKNGSIPWLLAG